MWFGSIPIDSLLFSIDFVGFAWFFIGFYWFPIDSLSLFIDFNWFPLISYCFPSDFIDSLWFLSIFYRFLLVPIGSGTPPPIFDNFHQMDSVGSRSETNLLTNRVRKVEKRVQPWTLWKDFLQYLPICVIFSTNGNRSRKVDGGDIERTCPGRKRIRFHSRFCIGTLRAYRNFCQALSGD